MSAHEGASGSHFWFIYLLIKSWNTEMPVHILLCFHLCLHHCVNQPAEEREGKKARQDLDAHLFM